MLKLLRSKYNYTIIIYKIIRWRRVDKIIRIVIRLLIRSSCLRSIIYLHLI
jgi:hypothetical protein